MLLTCEFLSMVFQSLPTCLFVQDPVAYRLEPALAPCHHVGPVGAERASEAMNVPPPVLIAKTSRLFEKKNTRATAAEDEPSADDDEDLAIDSAPEKAPPKSRGDDARFCAICYGRRIPQFTSKLPLGRHPNRLDFSLERRSRRLSWEYVSALAAHTCYYTERDVISFVFNVIAEASPDEASHVSPSAEHVLSFAEGVMSSQRGAAPPTLSSSPSSSPVPTSTKAARQPHVRATTAPSALDLISSMVSTPGPETGSKLISENLRAFAAVEEAASARGHTTIARILADRKAKELNQTAVDGACRATE